MRGKNRATLESIAPTYWIDSSVSRAEAESEAAFRSSGCQNCYDSGAMILLLLITLSALRVFDASTPVRDPAQETPAAIGTRLMQDADVKAAVDRVKRNEPQIIEEQIRLCEIPSPPFKEARRAEAYRQAFQAFGPPGGKRNAPPCIKSARTNATAG